MAVAGVVLLPPGTPTEAGVLADWLGALGEGASAAALQVPQEDSPCAMRASAARWKRRCAHPELLPGRAQVAGYVTVKDLAAAALPEAELAALGLPLRARRRIYKVRALPAAPSAPTSAATTHAHAHGVHRVGTTS